jgi:hypothetical protein
MVQMALLRCQRRGDQTELHLHRNRHHEVPHPKTHDVLEGLRSREAHRIQNHRDHHLLA